MINFLVGSGILLLNLASLPLFILLSIILGLLVKACFNIRLYAGVKGCKHKYDETFFWNFYLRLLLEGSLEIGLIAMMDIFLSDFSSWG